MASDELDEDGNRRGSAESRYREFDCPSCSANNPVDPPFGEGDELLCNYCGSEFLVKLSSEGKVRLLEV